jgi:signal transduction histidine kinase
VSSLRTAVNCLIAKNQVCDGPDIEFYDDLTSGKLRSELQSAVVLIVQELLLNACRHSRSKNVLVGLTRDGGCLCVQVQDWGIGLNPESIQPHKRGLRRIHQLVERLGGTVEIDSHPEMGTCVSVEVPIVQENVYTPR